MERQRQRRGWRRHGAAPLACAAVLAAGVGCGEILGPGASPEPPSQGQEAGEQDPARWQAQAASHYRVPAGIRDARGVEFRLVPPGTFRMGSPAAEVGRRSDEEPYPATLLVPYYLQAREVTWAEVWAWRPELRAQHEGESESHPARGLSHDDVVAFIAWVNAGDATWYHRLPSEAEWEHACRAGAASAWSTGNVAPVDLWAGGAGAGPRRVGQGLANGLGLHDMHGNVAEWCRAWYAPYPPSAAQLPTGPSTGTERVVRGGSWRDPLTEARCAARGHLPPATRDARVGFRLLVEAGYGVPGLGPYRLRVQTYTGEQGEAGREPRPGVRVRLVSVPERLTARQEDRHIRWRDLEGVTPLTIDMLPGRYYLRAWTVVDGQVILGRERKFMIPDDLPEVDVELPGS